MNRNAFRVPTTQPGSRMPQYNPQQLPAAPGADVSARLSDGAAQIYSQGADQQAKGLEMLGRGMQQAAKAGYDLYGDYQTGKAREAFNQLRAEEMDIRAKLAGKTGKDAIDPENGVQANITKWQQEARARLTKNLGAPARELFDQAAELQGAKLAAWGIEKHQAEERTYLNQQDEGTIALDAHAMLADPMNATTAQNSVTNIKGRYKALRERNGWSEEYAQAKMNGQMEQVFTKMVETQINSENVSAARDLLSRYGGYLGSSRDALAHKLDEKAQTVHTEAVKSLVMSGDMQGAQDYMNNLGMAPRGIRNNNPGNIVRTNGAWEGEVYGHDGKFKTFATPEQGIAAVGRNLLSYDSKGLNTVSGIINRWAPPSENNTSQYVSIVSKSLGVSPDAKLDMKDPAVLASLTRAIIQHENGQMPYSDEQMQAGVDAALGKRKLSTPAGDTAKPALVASEPGSGNLTPYSQSVLMDWIDKFDKKRTEAHDDAYGRTLAQDVLNGKADAEDVQTRLREDLPPDRAEKVWNGFQSEMTNTKEAREANANAEGLQVIAKAKTLAKNPDLDFKSVNAFLADVGEDSKGFARSKKILQQALVQQNKMTMPREVTDPGAKTAARAAIRNGMSFDSAEMQYGDRLSSSDLDDLHTFAGDKELQKANRKATAFWDEMVLKSGLNVNGTGANEEDKLYLAQKKAEFEDMVANNEFKSRDDQKAWIYGILAKRTKPGMIWDSSYTPREAQGRVGTYVPVPDFERSEIKRAMENANPPIPATEENIQAAYSHRLNTRGY